MPRWSTADWQQRLEAVVERMRADGQLAVAAVVRRPGRARRHSTRELERRGWVRALGETVLWVGHASVVPHLDPRLRIEAVQPACVAIHERLEREIFGIDADAGRATARQPARRTSSVAGCAPGSSGSSTSPSPWRA